MGQRPAALADPGAVAVLLAAVVGVQYATVPETDQLRWVVAVVVVLALVEVVWRRTVPAASAAVVVVLVAWAGWFGGRHRGGAVVGAWFAWWPWVVVWVVHLVSPRRLWLQWTGAVVATAAALWVARAGALGRAIGPALADVVWAVLATAVLVALGGVGAWVSRARGARRRAR